MGVVARGLTPRWLLLVGVALTGLASAPALAAGQELPAVAPAVPGRGRRERLRDRLLPRAAGRRRGRGRRRRTPRPRGLDRRPRRRVPARIERHDGRPRRSACWRRRAGRSTTRRARSPMTSWCSPCWRRRAARARSRRLRPMRRTRASACGSSACRPCCPTTRTTSSEAWPASTPGGSRWISTSPPTCAAGAARRCSRRRAGASSACWKPRCRGAAATASAWRRSRRCSTRRPSPSRGETARVSRRSPLLRRPRSLRSPHAPPGRNAPPRSPSRDRSRARAPEEKAALRVENEREAEITALEEEVIQPGGEFGDENAPAAASAPKAGPAALVESAHKRSTLDLAIEYPAPEEIFGGPVGAFLSGHALALQGDLRRFDVMIVLDVSLSTGESTGVDVNGNGVVGASGLQGLFRGMDAGDSILAAEVAAARKLLGSLDPRIARVGLASFAGGAPETGGMIVLGSRVPSALTEEPLTSDYKRVERALDGVLARGPWGNTHMAAGLDQATIELLGLRGALSEPNPKSSKVVLFLTDGLPTLPSEFSFGENVNAVVRAADRARRAGIKIHSFAIGQEALSGPIAPVEMAHRTGGEFTPVREPGRHRRGDGRGEPREHRVADGAEPHHGPGRRRGRARPRRGLDRPRRAEAGQEPHRGGCALERRHGGAPRDRAAARARCGAARGAARARRAPQRAAPGETRDLEAGRPRHRARAHGAGAPRAGAPDRGGAAPGGGARQQAAPRAPAGRRAGTRRRSHEIERASPCSSPAGSRRSPPLPWTSPAPSTPWSPSPTSARDRASSRRRSRTAATARCATCAC